MKTHKPDPQKFSSSNEISELWRGHSTELLKQLHILTRDGKLNADSRRKLKQVYHLVQFIEPLIRDIYASTPNPLVVDMGAGKSYLGFILYDLVLRNFTEGNLVSIESRKELIAQAESLAHTSGFDRMKFLASTIEDAPIEPLLQGRDHVDMVCALHACDTATDDAILFGLKHHVTDFVLVPCCQAELSRQLQPEAEDATSIQGLWRFPLHKREFASHLTNVIRVLFLESQGYKVTVTELIGWEHSMKNELILAHKTGKPNLRSREQLEVLLKTTQVKPKLLVS